MAPSLLFRDIDDFDNVLICGVFKIFYGRKFLWNVAVLRCFRVMPFLSVVELYFTSEAVRVIFTKGKL
jgi:hypothetical protein